MLLKIIIWFLIMYGIINIVLDLWKGLWFKENKNNEAYILIFVKNQEDKIEGIIKSTIYKNIYMDNFKGIIVVDMGSTDDTKIILNNLAKENDYIEVY